MDRHELALKRLAEGTVIPATPLALDENRQLSRKGMRLLMRYYLESGVGGIATAVHTTQFAIRDAKFGMYEPVLKLVSEEISAFEAEKNTVIVKVAGVCGETEQAVQEAELAAKYGYDAVLLSPGGLSHLSEEALLQRTQAVAKVMPVIGFYLQTAVGGRQFTYGYWEKLCAIPNVRAIKCASFDRYQTLDVVRAAATSPRAEEITLYTGNDDNILIDLLTTYRFEKDGKTVKKAFEGGLLGHWSVWTKQAAELFRMAKDARRQDVVPAGLLTLAAEVTDANSAFFDTAHRFKGCIAGLHYVLHRQGLMENIHCLDPEETLSPGQEEEIKRVCSAYPHLSDDDFIREHLPRWKADLE